MHIYLKFVHVINFNLLNQFQLTSMHGSTAYMISVTLGTQPDR